MPFGGPKAVDSFGPPQGSLLPEDRENLYGGWVLPFPGVLAERLQLARGK